MNPAAPRFDWSLVPSFLAVLEAGSLMAAARQLGAQQPTLSRHIAALEAQLGVALFERTGRGVQPTAAALALADSARTMAEGADRLALQVAGRQGARGARRSALQGTVRLSAPQVPACLLLPPLLVELNSLEPGVQVDLVATNAVSNLLRREADIALRMLRPQQSGLVARKLAELPIVIAAHADYLARRGTPRSAQDLLQHRLLGYDQNDALLRGAAAHGLALRREHFALRTDDQLAYGELLRAGAGLGFITEFHRRQLPGLVRVLPELALPSLPAWLVVHREIRGNPVVRRVFDFLAERLPEQLA